MASRAVHSKNHMTQETEKTLEGLYRYYSYVQLNLQSLLLTSPTFTGIYSIAFAFGYFSRVLGVSLPLTLYKDRTWILRKSTTKTISLPLLL